LYALIDDNNVLHGIASKSQLR
jgi:hypothetical protein